MRRNHPIACLMLVILMVWFWIPPRSVRADLIREPVWDGKFYPADREGLLRMMERLTKQAEQSEINVPPGKQLKALILPHAGYVYSGWTAAHASRVLREKRFSKVILIGPDHRVGIRNGAVSDAKAWKTPLGMVRLHRDAGELVKRSELFRVVPAVDRSEHSLEVIVPFLQYYMKRFELVPIVLGPGDIHGLAAAVDPLLDDHTLLVVSSDLSHYLPYEEAVSRDSETIRLILERMPEKLAKRDNCACGIMPILTTLSIARKHDWQPVMIHYSNSGDTAGGKDRVVGYAAIAFYGDQMSDEQKATEQFSEEKGRLLVRLARRTIMERFGGVGNIAEKDARMLAASDFDAPLGTFVTLTIGGQLRGCIGSLTGVEPVREDVRRNAIGAAFHDPRFPPLSADEIDQVDIEVSILTEPQPLRFTDSHDLLALLRPGIDGVIIRKGAARATFLPQVWKQLPKAEDFLSRLCMKAGLAANAWKKNGLEVSTYQVQYFEEHR